MSVLAALLISSALAPTAGAVPASAPRASQIASGRKVRINVTTLINGAPGGEVAVETDAAGHASVDSDQLLQLLEPVLAGDKLDALRVRMAGRPMVSVDQLDSPQLPVLFNVAALQLTVTVPLDARTTQLLSISGSPARRQIGKVAPSNLAAGVTFLLGQHFNHSDGVFGLDRDPLTLAARGFVNVGGVDGWTLAFLAGYREHGRPFRQRTTLFHDDVDGAIRYSLGDITPQYFGAYSAPDSVIGVGVERLYQTIQPYRNLRPAGRGGLQLDRPSTVDVYVNGSLYRSLQLQSGRYDLRDFPFLDGLNDVRLQVRDDTGSEESIALSFFSDTELLDPGISIFSAVAGFRQESIGYHGTRYEGSPAFSGFYQRGLNDRLTLGGGLQADRDNALVTGLGVVATPIGIIGAQTALDVQRDGDPEYAALLSYRLRHAAKDGRATTLDVDLQYRSAGFSPMLTAPGEPNRYRVDVSARVQTEPVDGWFINATAGYNIARRSFHDLKSASLGIAHRFGRIQASLNYNYLSPAPRADHRVGLTLSLPVGRRQQLRAGFESDRNRVFADYDLQGFEGLNQVNARGSLARTDEGVAAIADAEYFGNRFRANLHHSYETSNHIRQESTDVGVAFGIGYADGQLALGRDADRGFTIVSKHPTLGESTVTASDVFAVGPSARTGLLGPALVPVQRGYQPDTITVEVEPLPPGYDIGAGRIDILPGAASGYLMRVGSAASNIVIGRLLNAAGEPVAYMSGQLVPINGKGESPVFITNRQGRLVAQKVAPGRYRIVPAGGSAVAEITVPEDARGMVQAGVIRMKE